MVNRKIFSIEKHVQSSIKNRFKFNRNEKGSGYAVNFRHVFRPIYYFARLFGQLPFSIVQRPNSRSRQSRVTKFDALWFLISICVYLKLVQLFWWFMERALVLSSTKPTIYLLVTTINMLRLVNILFGLLILIMDMCNRHRLVRILNNFTAFDRKVRATDIDFKSICFFFSKKLFKSIIP